MSHEPYYADISPLTAGLKGSCPRCGRGKLFNGYLKLADKCNNCGLDFDFADAGDGAAWFVMLISGFVAIGGALWLEITYQPPYWVHAVVALPLAVVLPLMLLRPAKGILVCQQYQTKAKLGELSDDDSTAQ